jgi:hypothetical protein
MLFVGVHLVHNSVRRHSGPKEGIRCVVFDGLSLHFDYHRSRDNAGIMQEDASVAIWTTTCGDKCFARQLTTLEHWRVAAIVVQGHVHGHLAVARDIPIDNVAIKRRLLKEAITKNCALTVGVAIDIVHVAKSFLRVMKGLVISCKRVTTGTVAGIRRHTVREVAMGEGVVHGPRG